MPADLRASTNRLPFWPLLVTFLAFAVGHTLWSTSLDSFTIDEPCHIAAGATYLRWHDFRINPEHPPLVKLVAALAEPASVLHVAPFDKLEDKSQERVYTQTAVYLASDYHAVQRRARIAMIAFNTLLLAALTFALRRVFSPAIGLGTLLLLALDPTVSAHMPVVMTDLPLALLGTVCCALAILAMRCRRWADWALFGLAGGLLLGTKHSAPLILLPLFFGCIGVLAWRAYRRQAAANAGQFGRLLAAAALSLVVLWSLYGFRFNESRNRDPQGRIVETFNRSMEDKIGDLHSPFFKRSLTIATRAHLLPRAYLWGLADTLRAGVEGRPGGIVAFGRDFEDKAPAWVAFAFLLVKVPLPFTALAFAGLVLLAIRRFDSELAPGLAVFTAMLVFFMAFIAKNGVFYAGIRHWLFAVPLMAVLASAAAIHCLRTASPAVQLVPIAALILIAVPTLPQRRIWEYHNLLAGGSGNAWLRFENESVDLGQRSDEILAFCKANMKEDPLYHYPTMLEQMDAAGIHRRRPKPEEVADGNITGWLIGDLPGTPAKNWRHVEALRTAVPVARFGNAVIYHGTFYMPYVAGGILIGQAAHELNIKNGDLAKAEMYFKRGITLNPESSYAFVELGNFALRRGLKEEALIFYRQAVTAEQYSEAVRQDIRRHIQLVESHPVGEVPPMRIGKE